MNDFSLKNVIDRELEEIKLSDGVKKNIRKGVVHRKSYPIIKSIAASIAVIVLTGTTVFAGHYILNKVQVNETVLPELDAMQVVQMNKLDTIADENGMVDANYNDYDAIKQDLGVDLLDTDLSQNNPYMLGNVSTDEKDFLIVTIDNYILGDTSNYHFIDEENRYSYDSGEKYSSPVSLSVDIILSENQLNNGWDTDYLGLYEFAESYTSEQGYAVNIIEDTVEEENLKDYVSEKVAIFVADGIRYTLKGRTSLDEMKSIVDSMRDCKIKCVSYR